MKNKYSKKDNLRLWTIYHGMKKRCLNPNSPRYEDYGGRGIAVCDEWLQGFDNFAEWALTNGYNDTLTIERIDNDGDYTTGNCKWIPLGRQCFNKRTSLMIRYNGKEKCLMDWCNILGLPYDTIHHRVTNGWSAKSAFETPVQNNKNSLLSKCKERGLNYGTIRDRIKKLGWSEERALNTPILGRGANQSTYTAN